MARRFSILAAFALVALTTTLVAPSDAHADLVVGADVATTVSVGDWGWEPNNPGFSADVRLGYAVPLPLVRIIPEVVFDYGTWSTEGASDVPIDLYSGRVGVRAGLGGLLGPGLYAHVGYGTMEASAGDTSFDSEGLIYDVGATLDFTLLPIIALGVHGEYDMLVGSNGPEDESTQWLEFGVHAELSF